MATAQLGPAISADCIPRNPEPPLVLTKELQDAVLLQTRKGFARLDIGPFLFVYQAIAMGLAHAASFGQWHRFTLLSYFAIGVAVCHILVLLFQVWNVQVKAFVTCSRVKHLHLAERVMVIPASFSGQAQIVPLEFRNLKDAAQSADVIEVSFEFRKHRFVYHEQGNAFEKLRYPVREPFSYYLKASGYGSADKVATAVQQWGLNKFEVPVPPFSELLKEQMLAPFFCFQVFCVALWCIDEYWYYSIFTLFMLVMFECTVVHQRLRNLRELHSLQTPKQRLSVYRAGKWEVVPGEALLPGDVISIGRPSGGPAAEEKVVPADCLLLAGNCIVEEAVLTGESTPQWKVPVNDAAVDPSEHLNIKVHKAHVLFGGTKILQHTGDKAAKIRTPDGGCLAIVLRTGFETSQGRLMRTILYSTERVTANSLETGLFICFLLIFAVSAAYYVLKNGLADPKRDRFKLILNCIMIVTSVIPPELPMELTIAVNTSLVALARKKVFCTEPFRIPFAGKVEVCCFDKTGTLTTDHLLLEGVAGLPGHDSQQLISDPSHLPAELSEVLATCQSLVLVEGELIGDPLEKAALQACGWTYSSDVALSPERKIKATILQRYHFSSALRRMAAVVRVDDDDAVAASHVAVVKGAPEVIKQYLAQPPADYDSTYKHFAAQGARVIALARRQLPSDVDAVSLRHMPREEVEKELEFVGFAVFQCPLKVESEPSLRALAESSHQLVMITGDAPLTACYAAGQVHIVTREVLILQHRSETTAGVEPLLAPSPGTVEADGDFEWVSPSESVRLPFSRNWADILLLAAEYDLCLNGDAVAHIEAAGLGPKIIPLVQVFARVSPEQKELVIKTLRAAGRVTLMCGDGTNDVGGLKAAHVGVALLAPSEMADKVRKARAAGDKKGDKKQKGGAGASNQGVNAEGARGAAREVMLLDKQGKKSKGGAAVTKPGTAMLEEMRKAGKPVPPSLEKMAEFLDKMDSEQGADVPMVKPGDASMASPFTAKAPSVAPVTDILKQGRCTLVTTVQMFKILGLLCLSTAYALSVMYLQGVKLSDAQATLSGVLTAGMFFFISSAKPLENLSSTRPHPNIFNLYFFGSLLGQFAAQLAFLIFMYRSALASMPADDRLDSESDFKPNLVNSVCYLVEQTVQLSTFAVNYIGHPFNTSLQQNPGMRTSLTYSSLFLLVLIAELVPALNESFGLVPIPLRMRLQFVACAVAVLVFTFSWEHLLRHVFAAPTPPSKGYLAHEKELKRLQARKHSVKKSQ